MTSNWKLKKDRKNKFPKIIGKKCRLANIARSVLQTKMTTYEKYLKCNFQDFFPKLFDVIIIEGVRKIRNSSFQSQTSFQSFTSIVNSLLFMLDSIF